MARAWVVHNVEEVGVLEHLLPVVLSQRPEAVGLGDEARVGMTTPLLVSIAVDRRGLLPHHGGGTWKERT